MCVCVCVCACVTPNSFNQSIGIRYDASPHTHTLCVCVCVCVLCVVCVCVCACDAQQISTTIIAFTIEHYLSTAVFPLQQSLVSLILNVSACAERKMPHHSRLIQSLIHAVYLCVWVGGCVCPSPPRSKQNLLTALGYVSE